MGGEGAEGSATMGQLILFGIAHLGEGSLITVKRSRVRNEQRVKAKPTSPPFSERNMSITTALNDEFRSIRETHDHHRHKMGRPLYVAHAILYTQRFKQFRPIRRVRILYMLGTVIGIPRCSDTKLTRQSINKHSRIVSYRRQPGRLQNRHCLQARIAHQRVGIFNDIGNFCWTRQQAYNTLKQLLYLVHLVWIGRRTHQSGQHTIGTHLLVRHLARRDG